MPHDEKDTRSFEVTIEIKASPEQVWKAVSDAEEIAKWFAPEVRVTPGAGGEMFISWGGESQGTMKIEAWEENTHLGLAQYRDRPYGCAPEAGEQPGDQGEAVTRRIAVDYFIEAGQGSTVLRLVNSGFGPGAAWDDEMESTRRGWPAFLRTMKHCLEKHWGQKARLLTISVMTELTADEAWHRLMSPQGLLAAGSSLSAGEEGRYRFRTPDGEVLEGELRTNGHRHFTGTVENVNDALLVMVAEGVPGKAGSVIYFMLTVFGETIGKAQEIEDRWSRALNAVFSPPQS